MPCPEYASRVVRFGHALGIEPEDDVTHLQHGGRVVAISREIARFDERSQNNIPNVGNATNARAVNGELVGKALTRLKTDT